MGRDQLRAVAFEMIRRSIQLLFALTYDRFGAASPVQRVITERQQGAETSGSPVMGRTSQTDPKQSLVASDRDGKKSSIPVIAAGDRMR
jgi:hypothetical protein